MLCVKKFLNCASLECFGVVYGWYSLAITIVAGTVTCSKTAYYIPEDFRIGLVVLIQLAFMLLMVYFNFDFIRGVKENDHRRMTAFKTLCIANAALLSILLLGASAQYALILVQRNQYQKVNYYFDSGTYALFPDKDLTILMILSTVYVAWSLYCTVCIISLHSEIKNKSFFALLAGHRRDMITHNLANNPMAPQEVSIKF